MNALVNYTQEKAKLDECVGWAEMLGKTYYGGTSGRGAKGHLHSLQLAQGEAAPTIYYQYSDGSKNYHHCPKELLPFLNAAIKARFPELLADALDRQKQAVRDAAHNAVKEHKALMGAAGLPVA